MNKETIIRIAQSYNSQVLNLEDINKLLIDYCVVEKHKDMDKTLKLINILTYTQMLFPNYIETALRYYKVKFNICELYSKDNKIIRIF